MPSSAAEDAPAGEREGTPSKWTTLGLVAIGVFMCTLDTSIVNVSLPAIASHFGVPLGAEVEWIVIAYLVVIASLLLTIGRLADRVGRRPIWIAGLVVFTAASAACGVAPALWVLVAARAVQGIGGALLMAVSPAMLTEAFGERERGRALGLNAMVVAFGVSAGPSLGGVLTETLSWRWIFFLNVPIGAVGTFASIAKLARDRRGGRASAGGFDRAGAVLLGVALAALTAGMSLGNSAGWGSPIVLGLAGAAVGAAVALVLVERRAARPVLDAAMFRDRVFASATTSLVLSFLASFAVAFLMPFYLQQLHGYGPERTGLMLTPFALTIGVVAPISGRLADRIGTRGLAFAGMAIMCVGMVALAELDAQSGVVSIVWRQVVAAAGMALFQAPNNSALMGAAPRDKQGAAAGTLATGRVIGQSLAVAIAGAVFGAYGADVAGRQLAKAAAGAPRAALEATFVRGFHAALLVSAALAAVSAGTSLLRGREQKRR